MSVEPFTYTHRNNGKTRTRGSLFRQNPHATKIRALPTHRGRLAPVGPLTTPTTPRPCLFSFGDSQGDTWDFPLPGYTLVPSTKEVSGQMTAGLSHLGLFQT